MTGRGHGHTPLDTRSKDRRRAFWATLAVLAGIGLVAVSARAVAQSARPGRPVHVAVARPATTTVGASSPAPTTPVAGQVLSASATSASALAPVSDTASGRADVAVPTTAAAHSTTASTASDRSPPALVTTLPPAIGGEEITTPGLWLMARDGSGLRHLVNGQPDTVTWSPNDSRVALGENSGIDIVDVADGSATHLVSFPGPDRIISLAWSPDGARIAANVMHNPTSVAPQGGISDELVIVNAATGMTASLGDVVGGAFPTWSARGCLGWAASTVNIWCPGEPLLNLAPFPGSNLFGWSPDGTHYAITSSADTTPGALLTYAADGSGAVDLGDTGVFPFSWAGDGQSIVFESVNPVSGNLWDQPVSGGPARVLGVPNGPFAVNGVDDGVIMKIGLSPGPSRLVSLSTEDPTQHEVATISPATGGVTALFWSRDGRWLLADAVPAP